MSTDTASQRSLIREYRTSGKSMEWLNHPKHKGTPVLIRIINFEGNIVWVKLAKGDPKREKARDEDLRIPVTGTIEEKPEKQMTDEEIEFQRLLEEEDAREQAEAANLTGPKSITQPDAPKEPTVAEVDEDPGPPRTITFSIPGTYVYDATNKTVWGGGAMGWVPIGSRVKFAPPLTREGSIRNRIVQFKNGEINEKWKGKYDPNNLKLISATEAYQMSGLAPDTLKNIPGLVQKIESSRTPTVSLGLLSVGDVPQEVLDAKKAEHDTFTRLMELRRLKQAIQDDVIKAKQLLVQDAELLEKLKALGAEYIAAQAHSATIILSSITGLEAGWEPPTPQEPIPALEEPHEV